MKYGNNHRQSTVFLFLGFLLLSIISVSNSAAEEYVFERMWPVLEQPWYFQNPSDVEIDASGNVYVADTYNECIQKFTLSGTFINKWGSYGTGDGEFDYPQSIAIDNMGNVYVADAGNDRIQKFTSSGDFITKWGSEGSGDGEFCSPWGIAVDAENNVYVADNDVSANSINPRMKFSSNGEFITKWYV